MTDLFTVDFARLSNDERYSAVAEFAKAQPGESSRHDFKLLWNNDALKDVAALANTFGGILIIGVRKGKNDADAQMSGVDSSSELTTGIASSIATNISPTPSYDVMECNSPAEPRKRFCVVRVRGDSRLYLVTKKGLSAAFVRNADETIPADAAQLRGLIEREKHSARNKQEQRLARVSALFEEMVIGRRVSEQDRWPEGNWVASDTFFRAALVPNESKLVTLDARDEHKFIGLIHRNYGRVAATLGNASRDAHNRSADHYEYRWYHKNLDYEGR